MNFTYVNQEHFDDSIYRGAIDFSEVVSRIPTPEEQTFIFQYQKDLKTRMLHFRQHQLNMEENVHNKNAEREVKESLASSSSAPVEKSKDKGKYIVDGPIRTQPSSTFEPLQR